MTTLRLIAAVAVGASMAASSYAAVNRLYAEHFMQEGQTGAWVGTNASAVDRHMDKRNPLDPCYGECPSDMGWKATGDTKQGPDIRIDNPLHPQFRR